MYKLKIKSHFDSAHFLRDYEGQCKNIHGHRFEVEVVVESKELDNIGFVVDFSVLKRLIKQVTSNYDHKFLNDLPDFKNSNPTAENLARIIYTQFKNILLKENLYNVKVLEVTVWESPEASATYSE